MKFWIISSIFILMSSQIWAEPVEDNSFLVEEAYNQEPGVIQFINVYQKSKKTKDWSYVFINEIPVFSQTHQFSYEIPYSYLEASDKSAVGDLKVNYRNEFFRNDQIVTTGRISTTLGNGDHKTGFGIGSNFHEVSLISSIKVSDRWVQHWNLGAGFASKAKNTTGQTADNSKYFFNVSNIYLFTDQLNFMLEMTSTIDESTTGENTTEWGKSFIASPSVRYAIDAAGWQFVPGIAFPTNLGENAGSENQTLIYLSIEGEL